MSKIVNGREAEYEIQDIFLERFSPRAMSGEAVAKDELYTLFEAARWAPSASNVQPWRFIYALRGTPEFEALLGSLMDFNKVWCVNASALVLVISHKVRVGSDGTIKPATTNSLDTGAAWENFALQASTMGIIAHGMAGFDYAVAKEKMNVPDDYAVEMMIAVGKPGDPALLPEKLREREAPSDRKPLSEIVFEGKFPN